MIISRVISIIHLHIWAHYPYLSGALCPNLASCSTDSTDTKHTAQKSIILALNTLHKSIILALHRKVSYQQLTLNTVEQVSKPNIPTPIESIVVGKETVGQEKRLTQSGKIFCKFSAVTGPIYTVPRNIHTGHSQDLCMLCNCVAQRQNGYLPHASCHSASNQRTHPPARLGPIVGPFIFRHYRLQSIKPNNQFEWPHLILVIWV